MKMSNMGVKTEDYNRFSEVKALKEMSTTELFHLIVDFYIKEHKSELRAKFEKKFENIVS